MTFSCGNSFAEVNAKLLINLMKEHGAIDLGSISGFFEVTDRWCCPSCHRSKAEQARLDKNGNLMCALHWHHDHMVHAAQDRLPMPRDLHWIDRQGYESLVSTFHRFPDTLVCNDCNVVEGDAKKKVGAPAAFSFSPFEISTFIIVTNNRPHTLDVPKACTTWNNLYPSLSNYRDNLKQITNYDNAEPDSFEQIGGAAWRVLKDIRKKMNENKDQ